MTLVARYKLDRDAKDTGPNGLDGINTNVTFVTGQVNNAGDLDGTAYVDCGDSLPLSNTPIISVFAWIYPRNNSVTGVIVSKVQTGFTAGWEIENTSGDLRVTLRNSVTDLQVVGSVDLNEWQWFGFTYDGTNLKIYKNNEEIGSKTGTSILDTTDKLVIGARLNTFSSKFDGLIDDVNIFDHVLTEDERTALFNRTATREIEIGGVDYSTNLITLDASIIFGQAKKFSSILNDTNNTIRNTIRFNDVVLMYVNGDLKWRAYIDNKPVARESHLLALDISGLEKKLLQKFITVSFTNQTISQMIKTIISTFYSGIFTTNNVPDTTTQYTENYRFQSPWFIFQDLSKREDLQVFVDEDNDIHLNGLFMEDSGQTFDYNAGDEMFRPDFPNVGKAVKNAVVVHTQMTDPETGEGGIAVRYNNLTSIQNIGERIEAPPITDTTSKTVVQALSMGQEKIDPVAFELQDGIFDIRLNADLFAGQILRVTLDSKNFSLQQFIIKEILHKFKPPFSTIKVAEVEDSTIRVLKDILRKQQANEERHSDASAIIIDNYVLDETIESEFKMSVFSANVGDRVWRENAWRSFSWRAGAPAETPVISDEKMVITTLGKERFIDLIEGLAVTPIDGSNAHVAVGSGTTPAAVTDTTLETEDLRKIAAVTQPTSTKLRSEISITDSDIVSDAYTEVGLLDNSVGGLLFSRQVSSISIAKVANETLRFQLDLEIV